MNEAIKLKVPTEGVTVAVETVDPKTKEKVIEKQILETVSQGNFQAELVPGATIETTSREFADWLIHTHGLTEVKPKKKQAADEAAVEPNAFAATYPASFPGAAAFVSAEIPFETVQGLTREQILKVPNIGEQTADEVLAFLKKPVSGAPSVPVAAPQQSGDSPGDNNAEENSEKGEAK